MINIQSEAAIPGEKIKEIRHEFRAHLQEVKGVGEYSDHQVNRIVFVLSFFSKTSKAVGLVPMYN